MDTLELKPTTTETELMDNLVQQSRDSSPLCDVQVILTPHHILRTHRGILAHRSSYYRVRSSSDFYDSDDTATNVHMDIEDTDPEACVRLLTEYLYEQIVYLRYRDISGVTWLADFLGLELLKQWCEVILTRNLTPENLLTIWKMSIIYSMGRLEELCSLMVTSRFQDYIFQKERQSLDDWPHALRMWTPDSSLMHTTTAQRSQLLLSWVLSDTENRVSDIQKLASFWRIEVSDVAKAAKELELSSSQLELIEKSTCLCGLYSVESLDSLEDPLSQTVDTFCAIANLASYDHKDKDTCSRCLHLHKNMSSESFNSIDGYLYDGRNKLWRSMPCELYNSLTKPSQRRRLCIDCLTLPHHQDLYLMTKKPFDIGFTEDFDTMWKISHYKSETKEVTIHSLKEAVQRKAEGVSKLRQFDAWRTRTRLELAGVHKDVLYIVYGFRVSQWSSLCDTSIMVLVSLPLHENDYKIKLHLVPNPFTGIRNPYSQHTRSVLSTSAGNSIYCLGFFSHPKYVPGSIGQRGRFFLLSKVSIKQNLTAAECDVSMKTGEIAKSEVTILTHTPSVTADEANETLLVSATEHTVLRFCLKSNAWLQNIEISPSAQNHVLRTCACFPTQESHKDQSILQCIKRASEYLPCREFEQECRRCISGCTVAEMRNLLPHVTSFMARDVTSETGCWRDLTPPPCQHVKLLTPIRVSQELLNSLPVAHYTSTVSTTVDLFEACCSEPAGHSCSRLQMQA